MSTAAPDTPPQVQQMALADLGLKPGIALQVRRLVEGATKKEAQLFGAIKDRGVMVGPQGTEGEDPGMTEGDVCIVRGFTGQFEFSFVSKVIQTYEKPFVYALLVYPASVDARLVRQSMRTRTRWPVTTRLGEQQQAGLLVDISMQGAMVSTPQMVGAVGKVLSLTISGLVEGELSPITVKATICHSNTSAETGEHFTGMAFHNVGQHEKLVLNYLTNYPNL